MNIIMARGNSAFSPGERDGCFLFVRGKVRGALKYPVFISQAKHSLCFLPGRVRCAQGVLIQK